MLCSTNEVFKRNAKKLLGTISFAFVAVCCVPTLIAASESQYTSLLNSFEFRNLGPFRAGSWVPAIAVPEQPAKEHSRTFYVAARNGGLWKTTNSGTTFEPMTDAQGIMSIGAVAVAPSNADIVWLGGGDASNTRSAYYGEGVFRSLDGAKTWQHMGLKDTQHIARIVIHPSNPQIVYVAALGHLYTPNEERGVFKTTDGGQTWNKILYVGPNVGAVDLVMDPRSPNTLFAATNDFQRFPWAFRDGGPGSGIYKTTDAGVHWTKLAGGLPSGTIGRIGLTLCQTKPDVIYAVLDNFNPKANNAAAANSDAPPARDVVGGEVYRTEDSGTTWHKMNSANDDVSRKTGYAFNQIRVDPNNSERIFITGSNLISSEDGGKTWAGLGRGGPGAPERPFRRAFGDFRTLWIDPQDSDHMIAGSDGGVFVSFDGGKTCDHFSNLKLGEIYALTVDMEKPYNIFAGLQDHESWMGPSNGPSGSVGIEDWKTVGIGDGQYNAADPNGRYEYNDQEFGHAVRVDLQERTRTVIAPTPAPGKPPLRINWTAPLVLSPHDSKTVYFGAEMVFRSRDRGDHWEIISPDLTTNDSKKISGPRAAIQHCTITTLAESPAQADVIWAGTDDGKVQVTRDGGQHWADTTRQVAAAGGPEDAWVTRVFPSRFDPATVYITKSRRHADDSRPFVLRSADFGATWTMLTAGLSSDSAANVIAEDTVKPNLLFVGTDKGLYVSFDRAAHWEPFTANMPPAPVNDLVVHPREGDLVAGTFGRGIWVTNIVALREFQPTLFNESAHLFATKPFSERRDVAWGNYALYGDRYPVTHNEPNGMVISFLLKSVPQDGVKLQIADGSGKVLRHINAKPKDGMNRAVWLLDDDAGAPVPAGDYTINLLAFGQTLSQPAHLLSRAPEDSPRPRRFQRESTGVNDSENEIP